jgi:hypothetical protein
MILKPKKQQPQKTGSSNPLLQKIWKTLLSLAPHTPKIATQSFGKEMLEVAYFQFLKTPRFSIPKLMLKIKQNLR